MKILIPILGFDRAGGYRVLSELANAWIRSGHEVTFLCPDSSTTPYFPTAARILWVSGAGRISSHRELTATPSAVYHLRALFGGLRAIGEGYDVVLANHSLTAWPIALTRCGNARRFYYVQAYEPEYYIGRRNAKSYVAALLSVLSYHLPLRRIVNSPIYFRYRNLRARTCVPPGLDLRLFRPAERPRVREPDDEFVIGCIGRAEPEKGTRYVLAAFERLHAIDSRFRLKVAFGNLPAGWTHPCAEVVQPNGDGELADFYRSLDALVAVGTTQHGAPHYPVLEGLACGIAVITTGYLGASPETAWIVPNRDVDAIVSAILDVQGRPDSGVEKARQFDAFTYRWSAVALKMQELFTSVETLEAFNGNA